MDHFVRATHFCFAAFSPAEYVSFLFISLAEIEMDPARTSTRQDKDSDSKTHKLERSSRSQLGWKYLADWTGVIVFGSRRVRERFINPRAFPKADPRSDWCGIKLLNYFLTFIYYFVTWLLKDGFFKSFHLVERFNIPSIAKWTRKRRIQLNWSVNTL